MRNFETELVVFVGINTR